MRLFKKPGALLVILSLCSAGSVHAGTISQNLSADWDNFSNKVSTTWQQPDGTDFYLPAITWHNRATYDREHIEKYNERPWGAGGGISRYDEKGNWNGLYVMAFKDSYNKW